MSKLDLAKEQIGYLKLWLGIVVATFVSLSGWFLSNFQSVSTIILIAALLGLLLLWIFGFKIHKHIEIKILELEDL